MAENDTALRTALDAALDDIREGLRVLDAVRHERDEARTDADIWKKSFRQAQERADEAQVVLVELLCAVSPILGTSDDWQDGDGNPLRVQAALAAALAAARRMTH